MGHHWCHTGQSPSENADVHAATHQAGFVVDPHGFESAFSNMNRCRNRLDFRFAMRAIGSDYACIIHETFDERSRKNAGLSVSLSSASGQSRGNGVG
jgi:hypothetical protein